MCTQLVLSILIGISFASPLMKRDDSALPSSLSTWQPAAGYKTTCTTSSDMIIGLDAGPEFDTVINDACAAMMNPCAYQERLPHDRICIQTTTWNLDGPIKNTQPAKIRSTAGGEESGFKLQFAVTPPERKKESADVPTGVFWSREECYGYFAHVIYERNFVGGCHTDKSLGTGKIVIGGENTLKDTTFEVSIVHA